MCGLTGKSTSWIVSTKFTKDKLLLICHCYVGSSAWMKGGNNWKIQMSSTEGYETIKVIFRNNENNIWWLVIFSRGKWTCWKNILLMTFSWISAFFIYCLTKDNSTIDLNIGIEDRVCQNFGQINSLRLACIPPEKMCHLLVLQMALIIEYCIILNIANNHFLFSPSELLLDNV